MKEKISFLGIVSVWIVSIGAFVYGYHFGAISGALLFLSKEFLLTSSEQGMVVGSVLITALLGSVISGFLADSWGRKWPVVLAALLFLIGPAISALSSTFWMLLLGRGITGFAIGIIVLIAPLYISETAPAASRGKYVNLNAFLGVCGILTGYLVNHFLCHSGNWRWMLCAGIFPAFVLLLGSVFLPETPKWLRFSREEEGKKRWSALFAPSLRAPLLIGVLISAFQQVTGINAVIFFAPTIFQQAGLGAESQAIFATLGVGVANLLATFLSMKLIDKVGRRRLLLVSISGMIAALFAILFFSLFPIAGACLCSVVGLIVFVGFFGIGMGPVPFLLLSEIYPHDVRGRAMSVGTTVNWICNSLVGFSFLPLINAIGFTLTFSLFALLAILAWLFTYRFVPETAGKTLEQIEKEMFLP